MKQAILIQFFALLAAWPVVAQTTLETYLEENNANSLAVLAEAIQNPVYKKELKDNLSLVDLYVEQALSRWPVVTEQDMEAWKQSIRYVVALGYPMNTYQKSLTPLIELTSPLAGYGTSMEGSNSYLLHTSLLSIGAESERIWDGASYLEYHLMDADSLVKVEYLKDFMGWSKVRQDQLLNACATRPDDYGDPSVVLKALLSAGLDVNYRFEGDKRSLFDQFVYGNKFALAEHLMREGYNPNRRCFVCRSETSLHRVAGLESEWLEEDSYGMLLRTMLRMGADPNLRDIEGLTPLHWAIKAQNTVAFAILLEEDSKVDFTFVITKGTKNTDYLAYFDKTWKKGDSDFRQMLAKRMGREEEEE